MPDTTTSTTSDDAASLTALISEFGGLWQISRTPRGFRAQRRPRPAPPLTFTAETVPALRALLEHGYDTATLAGIVRDYGGQWLVERVDPGSAWVAVSRDLTHIIAAPDLHSLRAALSHTASDSAMTGTDPIPAG